MANKVHVDRLKHGIEKWNAWRSANLSVNVNLSEADLTGAHLKGANLQGANFQGANLHGAHLHGADLSEADLSEANLSRADLPKVILARAILQEANLRGADLQRADLHGANLRGADLSRAILTRAILQEANLTGTDLTRAILQEADISRSRLNATIFANTNLFLVHGLDSVQHQGPSTISTDTLYRFQGKIPEIFLRGCGVPDSLIEYLSSLIGATQSIEFYSCFISYSTNDQPFAQRLHGRLQQEHVRVWFAPHDLKIDKLYPQIDDAIRVYDKLLLILSEESIRSNWVETELRLALKKERNQNKRVLFPVRLTTYNTLASWRCIDADIGRDLAADVRSYYIGDFSAWKDYDAFEAAFARLLNDLRAGD